MNTVVVIAFFLMLFAPCAFAIFGTREKKEEAPVVPEAVEMAEAEVPAQLAEADIPVLGVAKVPSEAAYVASLVGHGVSLAAQAVEYEIEQQLHPERVQAERVHRSAAKAPAVDLRSVVQQAEDEALMAHAVAAQANAAAMAATARAAQARAQAAAEHAVAAGRAAQAANYAAAMRDAEARGMHLDESPSAALTGGNEPLWPDLTVAVKTETSASWRAA
jgi:hypothetical protein